MAARRRGDSRIGFAGSGALTAGLGAEDARAGAEGLLKAAGVMRFCGTLQQPMRGGCARQLPPGITGRELPPFAAGSPTARTGSYRIFKGSRLLYCAGGYRWEPPLAPQISRYRGIAVWAPNAAPCRSRKKPARPPGPANWQVSRHRGMGSNAAPCRSRKKPLARLALQISRYRGIAVWAPNAAPCRSREKASSRLRG